MEQSAQLKVVPVIHHDMSLNDILTAMDLHYDETLPLADEDLELVQKLLLMKVDGIKFRLDEWASDAARHQAYALEHAEAKRVIEKKAENLEKRVLWAMQRSNKTELAGIEFKVELKTSKSVSTTAEPLPEHATQYPDLVRVKEGVTTYHWNLTPVRQAIEKGFLFNFGQIVEKTVPKFSLFRKDK